MDGDQLTLGQVLRRARREFPHREVVSRERTGVVTTTYAELFERVDRLAHALSALGARRETR
jgi:acyl-CoA synthetase (AMP-forming)/AMP-acid ligase II